MVRLPAISQGKPVMLPEQTGTGFGEEYAIRMSGLVQICATEPQIYSKGTEAAKFRIDG